MRQHLTAALLLALVGCFPPTPTPPTPDPVDDSSWVIVIEESSERTPATAEVLRYLQASGLAFRVYDDDSDDASPYLSAVSGIERPALLVLDKNGKLIRATGLPDSVDVLKRLLGEVVNE